MHNIEYFQYPEKVDKEKVQTDLDHFVAMEDYGEGCNGLYHSIRWIDHICEDYESARDYIERHDKNDYDNLAVKYYTYDRKQFVPSKKLSSLKERLDNEMSKRTEYENAHSVTAFKAEYIGCPCCGSKLKKALLKGERCPLCNTDMRSKTTLDTLARYNKNISDIQGQVNAESQKIENKGRKPNGIKWLVKIEYHT